jgi:hypothetical protein
VAARFRGPYHGRRGRQPGTIVVPRSVTGPGDVMESSSTMRCHQISRRGILEI